MAIHRIALTMVLAILVRANVAVAIMSNVATEAMWQVVEYGALVHTSIFLVDAVDTLRFLCLGVILALKLLAFVINPSFEDKISPLNCKAWRIKLTHRFNFFIRHQSQPAHCLQYMRAYKLLRLRLQ